MTDDQQAEIADLLASIKVEAVGLHLMSRGLVADANAGHDDIAPLLDAAQRIDQAAEALRNVLRGS